eukprot:m.44984 g.44984  ORF g.44984 m.44984 type:complete len:136 (+) comp13063_c0_seq3:849-1256(+)
MIVDNCSMQLVSNPQQFDVMVTPNLYGNIVGNIGAGLVGGAGMVPGFNFGPDYAVFEPGARQIGEGIKGTHKASPLGMLASSAMMLKHIGFDSYAEPLEQALKDLVSDATLLTPDIGGTATTEEVTDAIIDRVAV